MGASMSEARDGERVLTNLDSSEDLMEEVFDRSRVTKVECEPALLSCVSCSVFTVGMRH